MATLQEALEHRDDARHILSFSGGKDSTALGIYLLEEYPQIPLEFVFCDTGAELPETYDYIKRFETIFGVTVTRLNALQLYGVQEKGERNPFDLILNELYGGFMPRPDNRWCTRELKIKVYERYLQGSSVYSYIGIRADEDRAGYQGGKPVVLSDKPNIIPVYPFKDRGLGLDDIKALLLSAGLGLPPYYKWRSRSGCYFCFYQQIGEWQGLLEQHPDLFAKAKRYEKADGGRPFHWVQGRPLESIAKLKTRYAIPDGEALDGCAVCHL